MFTGDLAINEGCQTACQTRTVSSWLAEAMYCPEQVLSILTGEPLM